MKTKKSIKNRVKQGNRSALGVQKRVKNHYDADEVLAAMCVWEWMLGKGGDHHQVVDDLFGDYGTGGMRSAAIQAGLICEAAWSHTEKNSGINPDEHVVGSDIDAFDWEFVPAVCRVLDWKKLLDNNQYGDTLWRPDPKEIVAAIIAMKALKVAA